MIERKEYAWGKSRSCIRELAEFGAVRKKEIGAENVFDYSLGNPSIPSPACVNESIRELLDIDPVALHGYTTAAGLISLREKIADNLNSRFNTSIAASHIYVTCGAAASLSISLRAILEEGEEVICNAPFFPEYRVFAEASGGKVVVCKPKINDDQMDLDIEDIEKSITGKTRAIIINSPNNPSGAIYGEDNLRALARVLNEAQEKYNRVIYLITDEPYRELCFDNQTCHSPIEYYDNTIMCYSWSKSLSLPGERIGYIALSDRMENKDDVYFAIMGSGRCLGYVNPPSLFQRVMEKCLDQHVDENLYKENRDILMNGLKEIGYSFIKPEGAFYLFVEALESDAKAFSEKAKEYELLIVPSDDFGVEGYVRLAYCVKKEMIEKSLPAFKKLYDAYQK